MNQNDTIDVNNDVNKLRVCLSDWVHSIRGILTSDLKRHMMNDGSIVTVAIAKRKRQRAQKQMRAECVSTMNGPGKE